MIDQRNTEATSSSEDEYDRVTIQIPRGMADKFKEKCDAKGTSQAQVLKNAIEQFVDDTKAQQPSDNLSQGYMPLKPVLKAMVRLLIIWGVIAIAAYIIAFKII